jgi:tetratricopeptide (TPR) repeat protein/pimeloyl-ACP methyl ester carboxylesterase
MAQIIHVGSGSGESHTNVVFLHGLGGDARKTWQHGPDDKLFWPRWLIDDLPGLSVYSIGYDASVSRWRGKAMHLTDRATNVLARILAEPGLRSGQLVLVGHSLGGLVIKQILQNAEVEAKHNAEAASFLSRVEKVAFLATPHTGSDLAAFGNRIRILAQPSAATTCLVRNDPNLRRLNSWYRTWANARGIFHLTLTETDAIRVLGMIVKPDSGDAGLAGSNPVPIDSDHWTICKPTDRTQDTYVFVRRFIESHVASPKNTAEAQLTALSSKVDRLVATLSERGNSASAEAAGVSREAIIRLAQRINTDVGDFEQAVLELERAVSVAIEVAVVGRRGSNSGDFADIVLARIANKSANGEFKEAAAEADTAFAQWERNETERRDSAIEGGLKLLEAGLKQDILLRDPVSAAKRIERMAAVQHPHDRAAMFASLRQFQNTWYESGRDKGLNFDLQVSIEAARLLVTNADGPSDTVNALIDLGVSLASLGERENGTKRLECAVATHQRALEGCIREQNPDDWASIQNNLGNALSILGEREGETARLEQAINAYHAALEEHTQQRRPLDWARIQNNLGNALAVLAAHERGTRRLEDAIQAFRAALTEYAREHMPTEWAATQNNLGIALEALGEREGSAAKLMDAIEAYRAALLEYPRERLPLLWAATQSNLATALRALGALVKDRAVLQQAVEACHAALLEQDREHVPLQWAVTQNTLGTAVASIGGLERSKTHLEQAAKAHQAALEEFTRERVPLDWAMTKGNLGETLLALSQHETGTTRVLEACEAYRDALQEYTPERVPYLHDRIQQNLAEAVEILKQRMNANS